jgi:plastocyanin
MEQKTIFKKYNKKMLLILLVILVIGVILALYSTKDKWMQVNRNESVVEIFVEGGSYEKARSLNPKLVSSPNISVKEIKDETRKDPTTVSFHTVVFTGDHIFPQEIKIKQSDVITFKNNSKIDISITGNDWGSKELIKTRRGFTQAFDFKGVYEYVLKADKEYNGKIIVE